MQNSLLCEAYQLALTFHVVQDMQLPCDGQNPWLMLT